MLLKHLIITFFFYIFIYYQLSQFQIINSFSEA